MRACSRLVLRTLAIVLLIACASPTQDPNRYRLSDSGPEWRSAGDDRVLDDLRRRYPEFFSELLDPAWSEDLSILDLREDLESPDAGRRRYDALNAVAVGYFELNARAQSAVERGDGSHYFSDSFRAAKLLSVPWRAYADIEDPALREAIIDFFEDVARGGKRHAADTAPRVLRTIESLAAKEPDPVRRGRIERVAAALRIVDAEARAREQP